MKQKTEQGYAAKHDKTTPLDAELAQALKDIQGEDGVSCENAHAIAQRQHKTPRESGIALDLLNLRIARCQLGLFGYTPRKRIVRPVADVDPALTDAIRAGLVTGRLSCEAAWSIAERHECTRLKVAEACEGLGIKIADCQLGAF